MRKAGGEVPAFAGRVPRMRRTGVALAVDRGDARLSHQGADALAPDLKAVALKHVAQHPRAGEREVQMKFIDPAHHCQVVAEHGLGQVVEVRARDANELGVAAGSTTHGHGRSFFCARIADATERAGQKIAFQRELSDLGLHVLDAGSVRFALLGRRQKHARGALEQLGLPLRNLIGMDVELLGQLSQRLVALQRGHGDLRLKCRRVVPSWPSHCCSFIGRDLHPSEQSPHLATSPDCRGQP